MKKLFAVLLTLTLVLSMGTIALAADGKITIENAIDGETYSIYKMFDFTPVSEENANQGRYTVVDDWKTFLSVDAKDYLVVDEDAGTIVWNGEETDLRKAELARLAVDYANKNNIEATASDEAVNGKVEFTGLDLGYYAIDTSLGALCALTNANTNETLFEKNQKPDIVKKIVEDTNRVDANNVAIGDIVNYETVVTVGKGLTNYIVHDKMSEALTPYDGDDEDDIIDIAITVNDAAVASTNYTIITENLDDDCTFEIAFDDDYIKSLDANTKIVITYAATLNESAQVGANGNPNTVKLEYTNETDVETLEDTVLTYTTKYTVEKVDGNGNPLAGAGFTLYKYDATVEGDDKWVAIGEQKLIESLDEGAKAIYEWNGLAEGQYKLVETKVPDGYNQAKDIVFTITCTELTDGRTEVTSVTDTADWSDTSDDVNEENETFNSEVQNLTGTLLPETGGIGTTIFYVVGGLLMAAAFILLVSKKRMASFA